MSPGQRRFEARKLHSRIRDVNVGEFAHTGASFACLLSDPLDPESSAEAACRRALLDTVYDVS